ncbi:MAG TPA: tetratricopeptide repeat protein [Candidatus Limnocylindrales bacterium]|nr:tetratricopeptide repeat protein [Candidatus Limnocylindrales bacterium]
MRVVALVLPISALAVTLAIASAPRTVNGRYQRGEPTGTDAVTFNRDIAPIVFRYCAPCHRPGEAAPFSLLTYADTAKFADQIAYITEKRIMPPWLPAPDEQKFSGELHLTDAQIHLFRQWAKQGAPEGDRGDLPPTPEFTPGWQLGKPDAILHAQKPYSLPPQGTDNYWNFIFRTNFPATRWVRAIEIRPGEKRVVHHANLLVDRLHSSRSQEKHSGEGFAGMELRIESDTFDPDSHFFFWKPGSVPHMEPADMALRLDPGDDLVLNVHLQPSGKPESIEPTIGLYFTGQSASKFPFLLELQNDKVLNIPPDATNFEVNDDFTLPTEVQLLAIYPHAHYLGRDLLASATYPDGTTKNLIHIPRWDLNWQAVFYYEDEVILPAGTHISMHYIYDNSAANIANPFHPPQRVKGGNRTTDEMAHLWLQVLPHGTTTAPEQARLLLQESIARHDVTRDPEDFAAQYNLGAMLQSKGDSTEALRHFQAAVRLRPTEPVANNALGAVLIAVGNPQEAVAPLLRAIRTRPGYPPAHYNLGNAYASMRKFDEAIRHFSEVTRLSPTDSMAEANLGAALAETGNLTEARRHLERALRLDPQNTLAAENLVEVKRRLASSQSR